MKEVLSLSYRPRRFSSLIGLQDVVKKIRGHKRLPKAWMFYGSPGAGKTTIARILSVSVQCTHQNLLGEPCIECRRHKANFDIVEINAGDINGINELRDALKEYQLYPRPGSKYRVYIIDEAQGISKQGLTLMLKYLEDCPKSTMWVICTTDPDSLLPAIRSRCTGKYFIHGMDDDAVLELVRRSLKKVGSKKPAEDLADSLTVNGITSPRDIVNAVELYVAGSSAEEAAGRAVANINVFNICRLATRGNWAAVSKEIKKAKPADARALYGVLCSYLRSMLLNGNRNSEFLANILVSLTTMYTRDDTMLLTNLTARLYQVSKRFR